MDEEGASQSQAGRRQKRKQVSKPRRDRTQCTLVCLVQAVAGKKLVVELRNDTILRGTLDESDEYMK